MNELPPKIWVRGLDGSLPIPQVHLYNAAFCAEYVRADAKKLEWAPPFFECWAMNVYPEFSDVFKTGREWGVGGVYGEDFNAIASAYRDIMDALREVSIELPPNCLAVRYRITNLRHEAEEWDGGYITQRAHWSMDAEVIGYDIQPEEEDA